MNRIISSSRYLHPNTLNKFIDRGNDQRTIEQILDSENDGKVPIIAISTNPVSGIIFRLLEF